MKNSGSPGCKKVFQSGASELYLMKWLLSVYMLYLLVLISRLRLLRCKWNRVNVKVVLILGQSGDETLHVSGLHVCL